MPGFLLNKSRRWVCCKSRKKEVVLDRISTISLILYLHGGSGKPTNQERNLDLLGGSIPWLKIVRHLYSIHLNSKKEQNKR